MQKVWLTVNLVLTHPYSSLIYLFLSLSLISFLSFFLSLLILNIKPVYNIPKLSILSQLIQIYGRFCPCLLLFLYTFFSTLLMYHHLLIKVWTYVESVVDRSSSVDTSLLFSNIQRSLQRTYRKFAQESSLLGEWSKKNIFQYKSTFSAAFF